MGYFYPSRLTVQAQGPKTVAAACGNWLMSHLVTALAQWQLPLGSWSQLEGWALQGRAVCPSSGVLRGQDGETEVQRGKGSSKGWLGEEGQLEGRQTPRGGRQFPIPPYLHLGGLCRREVQGESE